MESFTDTVKRLGHTDKEECHGYGLFYEMWLAPLRDRLVHVLEVGVCAYGGGGLLALAEYFPRGLVYGIDIDCRHCVDAVRGHPRVQLVEADAYDPNCIARHFGDCLFDVIIDDARHEIHFQLQLLTQLLAFLKPDGLYVV